MAGPPSRESTNTRMTGAGWRRWSAACTMELPTGLPSREDFVLPGREVLEEAFRHLDSAWPGGPFAEPARELLRSHAARVQERLRAYDQLKGRAIHEQDAWFVTHGEPHSAIVIRQADGGMRLVDWDTTLVAPRERDLWMVLDDQMTGWVEYLEATGRVRLSEEMLGLYRERWALAEICIDVAEFRRPHQDTEDMRVSWQELVEYLA